MRYFDSPKNRAIWEKEIARMETEREKRRQNGFKPVVLSGENRQKSAAAMPVGAVRRINLRELEMIVRQKKGLSENMRRSAHRERSLEKAMARDAQAKRG